jgi:hypothetical protein
MNLVPRDGCAWDQGSLWRNRLPRREEEVALMRRILLLVAVAAMMAAMMAVAGPAFATIHPLSNAECANGSASDVANEQEPPGISDFSERNFAQPVFSVSGGEPFSEERPSPAFKTFGTSVEDLDADFCPANK